RDAVGSPVRFSEGDAGGARTARADHDWAHARWRDGRRASGFHHLRRDPGGRISAHERDLDPPGVLAHRADRDRLLGARHGYRIELEGDGGFSDGDEFSRDAALVLVRCAVSITRPTRGPGGADAS